MNCPYCEGNGNLVLSPRKKGQSERIVGCPVCTNVWEMNAQEVLRWFARCARPEDYLSPKADMMQKEAGRLVRERDQLLGGE